MLVPGSDLHQISGRVDRFSHTKLVERSYGSFWASIVRSFVRSLVRIDGVLGGSGLCFAHAPPLYTYSSIIVDERVVVRLDHTLIFVRYGYIPGTPYQNSTRLAPIEACLNVDVATNQCSVYQSMYIAR